MKTKNSEGAHALNCTADTQDLGTVTYEWKEYKLMISEWKEGNWTKGVQLMVMSPKTCDKFSCRLISGSPSEAGDPVLNPLCEPGMCPMDGSNIHIQFLYLKDHHKLMQWQSANLPGFHT